MTRLVLLGSPGSGSQKHPHGWLNPRTKPGFGGHDGCSTWVALELMVPSSYFFTNTKSTKSRGEISFMAAEGVEVRLTHSISVMLWTISKLVTLSSHFSRRPPATGFMQSHTSAGVPHRIPSPRYRFPGNSSDGLQETETPLPSRHFFQPDSSRRYRSTFSATASLSCVAHDTSIAPACRDPAVQHRFC